MGFPGRFLELAQSRCIRLELLSLLDAERQEHSHHFEVAGWHRLFVEYAGKIRVEAFVITDQTVIDDVGHVDEFLRRRIFGIAERIDFDPASPIRRCCAHPLLSRTSELNVQKSLCPGPGREVRSASRPSMNETMKRRGQQVRSAFMFPRASLATARRPVFSALGLCGWGMKFA